MDKPPINRDHHGDSPVDRSALLGWTGPTDLLALDEVAELLGETTQTVLAACDAFPQHIPMVEDGLNRRFPSVALDVLRLTIDALASGTSVAAIATLIDANIPLIVGAIAQLANEVPPVDLAHSAFPAITASPTTLGSDVLIERVLAGIRASVEPAIQSLAEDMATASADILEVRSELAAVRAEVERSARTDDLESFRAESHRLASQRIQAPPVPLELLADMEALRDQVAEASTAIATIDLELKRQAASSLAGLDHLRQAIQTHMVPALIAITEANTAIHVIKRDVASIQAKDVAQPDLMAQFAPTVRAVESTSLEVQALRRDIALLREQQALAIPLATPDYSVDLNRALAPTLASLSTVSDELRTLRKDVAALQTQQSPQDARDNAARLARMTSEITLLRTAIDALDTRMARQDHFGELDAHPTSGLTNGAKARNGTDDIAEHVESMAITTPQQPDVTPPSPAPEIPSTIIGELIPRLPRRMGRSRSIDEK